MVFWNRDVKDWFWTWKNTIGFDWLHASKFPWNIKNEKNTENKNNKKHRKPYIMRADHNYWSIKSKKIKKKETIFLSNN